MTAYSMTMSATLNTFGGAPTDKWGAYSWSVFKWGEGTNTIPKTIVMGVSPTNLSVGSTAAVNWRWVHLLAAETLTPTGATVNFQYSRSVTDSLSLSNSLEHGYIQDSNNYFHVFPEGVTDLVSRSTPTWAQGGASAVTWTTGVAGSTTWS